jgi:hypothetical protein
MEWRRGRERDATVSSAEEERVSRPGDRAPGRAAEREWGKKGPRPGGPTRHREERREWGARRWA